MAGWKEQCCTLDHGAPRGFYSRSFAQGLYTHVRGFYSQCGIDITIGRCNPHYWTSSNPIAGQLQPEQQAGHPARFASRRPTWWDGVPMYATC